MADLIELKLKSPTGKVVTIQASEILTIDGETYVPAGSFDELLLDALKEMNERLERLEARQLPKVQT